MTHQKLITVGGYHEKDPAYNMVVTDEFVVTKNHVSEQIPGPVQGQYETQNYLTQEMRASKFGSPERNSFL